MHTKDLKVISFKKISDGYLDLGNNHKIKVNNAFKISCSIKDNGTVIHIIVIRSDDTVRLSITKEESINLNSWDNDGYIDDNDWYTDFQDLLPFIKGEEISCPSLIDNNDELPFKILAKEEYKTLITLLFSDSIVGETLSSI